MASFFVHFLVYQRVAFKGVWHISVLQSDQGARISKYLHCWGLEREVRYHQRRAWALLVCDASRMMDIVSSLLLVPKLRPKKTYVYICCCFLLKQMVYNGYQWFKPYECDILLTHIVTQLVDPRFFRSAVYLRCSRPWELLGAILCTLVVVNVGL